MFDWCHGQDVSAPDHSPFHTFFDILAPSVFPAYPSKAFPPIESLYHFIIPTKPNKQMFPSNFERQPLCVFLQTEIHLDTIKTNLAIHYVLSLFCCCKKKSNEIFVKSVFSPSENYDKVSVGLPPFYHLDLFYY